MLPVRAKFQAPPLRLNGKHYTIRSVSANFGARAKTGPRIASEKPEDITMGYVIGWILGVPTTLLVLWFVFSHL